MQLIELNNPNPDIAFRYEIDTETNISACLSIPFAVWASKLANEELYEAVKLYVGLLQSHTIVVHACYLYVYALIQLMTGLEMSETYDCLRQEAHSLSQKDGADIFSWFKDELDNDDPNDLTDPNVRPYGNIEIGIKWAFYYLKNDWKFTEALRDIVARGGDTAANAAIVGAMIGAA